MTVPPSPHTPKNACAHIHFYLITGKILSSLFLPDSEYKWKDQPGNLRKTKQDTKEDTFRGDQVLSGQESQKKPDEDVTKLALTKLFRGANKPPSSCLLLPSIPQAHQKKVKISRAFINRSMFLLHIAVKHWCTEETELQEIPEGQRVNRLLSLPWFPVNSDTHRLETTPGLKRTPFHIPYAVKEAKGLPGFTVNGVSLASNLSWSLTRESLFYQASSRS